MGAGPPRDASLAEHRVPLPPPCLCGHRDAQSALPSSRRGTAPDRGARTWCRAHHANFLGTLYPPPPSFCPGMAASLPIFSLAGGGVRTSSAAHFAWPTAVALGRVATPEDLASLPGFDSVPPKLVKRILAKEYVDIWELLPETWQLEAEGFCCHSKRPRRGVVTDISLWTECYSTMAAILVAAFPAKAPHLFAYLRTITKASRTFEGAAWASYDMAYRRQAAYLGSLDWGLVDPALYNEAFAGRAKLVPRCRYCLAETHSSQECPHSPAETAGGTDGRPTRPLSRPQGSSGRPASSVDICRLYNSPGGSRCRFPQCRYAHLCSRCRRPHSLAKCGKKARQQQTAVPSSGQPVPPQATSGSMPHTTEVGAATMPQDKTRAATPRRGIVCYSINYNHLSVAKLAHLPPPLQACTRTRGICKLLTGLDLTGLWPPTVVCGIYRPL